MTIEDIREFRENAISILKKNSQYATANAVEQAFSAMICLGQFVWERDVAVSQLEELGLCFGQKIDGIYLSKEEYEALLEYKYMYENLG